MTSNRFDHQKAITKANIQNALIELLNEKDFDEITVREIAERAEIGFKTFYRHYSDKTALARAMMAEMWEKISQEIELPDSLDTTEANIRQLLEIVINNVTVLKALGRTPLHNEIFAPILQFGFDEALQLQGVIFRGQTEQDNKLREIVASHFVNSHFQLIRWWAENDLTIPIDTMVNLISHLILQPIWNLPDSIVIHSEKNNLPS
jgi:AcrR family transcriptional regulator